MVASDGHDAVLMRALQQAAACLAPIVALHCPINQPLLPEAVKLGSHEAAEHTQHAPAVRTNGNSLASCNQGIPSIVSLMCDCCCFWDIKFAKVMQAWLCLQTKQNRQV